MEHRSSTFQLVLSLLCSLLFVLNGPALGWLHTVHDHLPVGLSQQDDHQGPGDRCQDADAGTTLIGDCPVCAMLATSTTIAPPSEAPSAVPQQIGEATIVPDEWHAVVRLQSHAPRGPPLF